MNKVHMSRELAEKFEFAGSLSKEVIDSVFVMVEEGVKADGFVTIPGFGKFVLRDRAARMGRNPFTGENIKIAAKRVFKFLPAKALKESVMAKSAKKAAKPAAKKATPKKSAAKKAVAKKSPSKKSSTKKVSRKK